MSRYRTGERTIDDYAAAQIAKILDINELIVISIANAEREKTVERVEFWKEKYNSLKGFSSLSLLIMTGLSSIALLALFAMHSICILC